VIQTDLIAFYISGMIMK